MFKNSRYRMCGVSLHNKCMAYNMNGCIPVLYVLSMVEIIYMLYVIVEYDV